MNIVGFNFTKILAERHPEFRSGNVNASIEVLDFQKDSISLIKDSEVGRMNFRYSVNYEVKDKKKDSPKADVVFEGNLILSLSKDEFKNIQKSWKKKQLPPGVQLPLYNFILKKCSPKAAFLEEEINLPSHLPVPQLRPQKQN